MNIDTALIRCTEIAPDKILPTDIFARRVARLAELLRDYWEEGSGFDTRFFQAPFIHDFMVLRGTSIKGSAYREHIVPRAYLRDCCLNMYSDGASVMQVQQAIVRHLGIVRITCEEAYHLDHVLKLKTKMPDGWRFGIDDPMARITAGGIELLPPHSDGTTVTSSEAFPEMCNPLSV